ncbi:MAG: hypothetical protein JNM84_25615 [Planctomycetes bacterium]|nr:hypothetical protein [Planctomycetota bacterium]
MTTDPVDPDLHARSRLPRLLEALHAATDEQRFTALGATVLELTRRVAPRPLTEAAAIVDEVLATPLPEGLALFAQRELRTRHAALPLHAAHLFFWGLSREGRLLRMDLDLFALPVDEEHDELTRFRVLVQGVRTTPQLADFVPAAPARARACLACRSHGEANGVECASCSGFGW